MKHDTCTSNSLGQAGPLKSDVARNVDAVFDPSPKMAPKNHDPLNETLELRVMKVNIRLIVVPSENSDDDFPP